MMKSLLKDSIVYGIGGFLTYGISVLLVPLYTRVFAPADYAVIDLLTIVASFVNVTIALEISQGLARFFPEIRTAEAQSALASTSLWFTLVMYTLCTAIAWLLSQPLSVILFGRTDLALVFQIALLSMWSAGILYLVQNQLRWQLQPKRFAIVGIISTTTSLLLTVLLVLILHLGLPGVFAGEFVGYSIGTLVALYFARSIYRFEFDWASFRQMLRFSIPLIPSSVTVVLGVYADRIVIRELLTMADLGLFGIAYRIVTVMNLIMFGFQTALTPLIYTHYAEPDTPPHLARIFSSFVAVAMLGLVALAAFARDGVMLIMPPEYLPAAVFVPLLAPAVLLNSMYVFAPGLFIAKKTYVVSAVNIMGAILNLILSYAFIPPFGLEGVALGTFLSSAITFTVQMSLSQRLYRVPHRWLTLGVGILIGTVACVVGAAIQAPLLLDIVVKLVLILVTGALFIGVGLINRADISGLWLQLKNRLAPPLQPTEEGSSGQ